MKLAVSPCARAVGRLKELETKSTFILGYCPVQGASPCRCSTNVFRMELNRAEGTKDSAWARQVNVSECGWTSPARWYDEQGSRTRCETGCLRTRNQPFSTEEERALGSETAYVTLPMPCLTFSSIFYHQEKKLLSFFLSVAYRAFSHSERYTELRFFGE